MSLDIRVLQVCTAQQRYLHPRLIIFRLLPRLRSKHNDISRINTSSPSSSTSLLPTRTVVPTATIDEHLIPSLRYHHPRSTLLGRPGALSRLFPLRSDRRQAVICLIRITSGQWQGCWISNSSLGEVRPKAKVSNTRTRTRGRCKSVKMVCLISHSNPPTPPMALPHLLSLGRLVVQDLIDRLYPSNPDHRQ
jgi:hypothetical protein